MLKWKIKNGDDKLKESIKNTKHSFESWYKIRWATICSREVMLSEKSPVPLVYYKMTKTFEEVKQKYPYEALQRCSSCGEYVDKWIETEFSFCDEHGCSMSLCKECANKIKDLVEKM